MSRNYRLAALLAAVVLPVTQAVADSLEDTYKASYRAAVTTELESVTLPKLLAVEGLSDNQARVTVRLLADIMAECQVASIQAFGTPYRQLALESVAAGATVRQSNHLVVAAMHRAVADGHLAQDTVNAQRASSRTIYDNCANDLAVRAGLPRVFGTTGATGAPVEVAQKP